MEVTKMDRYKKIITLSLCMTMQANAGMLDVMGTAFKALWEYPKTAAVFVTLSAFSVYNAYKIYAYKTDAEKKRTLESDLVRKLSKSDADKKELARALVTAEKKRKQRTLLYAYHAKKKLHKQEELAKSNLPLDHADRTQEINAIQKNIAATQSEAVALRNQIDKIEHELYESPIPSVEKNQYLQLAHSVGGIDAINYESVSFRSILSDINGLEKATTQYLESQTGVYPKNIGAGLIETISHYIEKLTSLATRFTKSYEELDAQYEGNFAYLGLNHKNAYELIRFDGLFASKLSFATIKNQIASLDNKETKRTLTKLFTDTFAKENYDTYLRGNNAWKTLQKDCKDQFQGESKYESEYLTNAKTQLTTLVWKIQAKMEGRPYYEKK